jgi:hypothetical protein
MALLLPASGVLTMVGGLAMESCWLPGRDELAGVEHASGVERGLDRAQDIGAQVAARTGR